MCDKKPYCNRQIDQCICLEVKNLPKMYPEIRKTISSCCGHGRYPKSIVVELMDGRIIDWCTKTVISEKPHKKRNRYYLKDSEGYYYLPSWLFLRSWIWVK